MEESIIVLTYTKGDKTLCSTYRGISLLSVTYKTLSNILQSRLIPYAEKLSGFIGVEFDATDQILIIHSAFAKYLRKKLEYNETVHQLFIDFKKACGSVRREVLYKILIGFGIPMKLVRLIKICLNETYSRVGRTFV